MPHPQLDEVANHILSLVQQGGDGNQLLLSAPPTWFVVIGLKGIPRVTCEVATDTHLPSEFPLSAQARKGLMQKGFVKRPHRDRLFQVFEIPDRTAAERTARLLCSLLPLYALPPMERVECTLTLGSRDPTQNPKVIAKMRELSKTRDQRTRLAMYWDMINATFLLPIDDAGQPVLFGELESQPIFGVFTDVDSTHHWDPRGMTCTPIRGSQLFPLLMQKNIGSLRINPEGDVGGELYRHEIKTIADAIAKLTSGRS